MAGAGPYPSFGSGRPGGLEQFPALSGWRITTSGLVVPRRQVLNSHNNGLGIGGTTTGLFQIIYGAAGATSLPGVLDSLNDGDAILVEQANLILAGASVLNALTVTGGALTFLRGGSNIATLQFTPPTLNVIPTGGIIVYSLPTPFAITARELQTGAAAAGASVGLPMNDWQFGWTMTIANSNAGAQSFNTLFYLQYRHFQGVDTA